MVALRQPEKISPQHGHARLTVEMVAGQSAVTTASSATPMKLLVPKPRGPSAWAFTSSFGGGLVAGDQTELNIRIGTNARAFIGTQASTKVYRNPAQRPCSHRTQAELADEALLIFAPDPVQAFAESIYTQRQEFHLAPTASLVLVDWFTSGRAARGERWQFSRLHSRNDVFLGGKRILLDSVLLDASHAFSTAQHQVGRFNCFATAFIVGKQLEPLTAEILKEIAARPVERNAALLVSASPVATGVLLRVAGVSVEEVGCELHRQLKWAAPLLGDDPWARKW